MTCCALFIYTYGHTYAEMYSIHVETRIATHMMQIQANAHTRTYTQKMRPHKHTCIQNMLYVYIHTQIQTNMHARAYLHTHIDIIHLCMRACKICAWMYSWMYSYTTCVHNLCNLCLCMIHAYILHVHICMDVFIHKHTYTYMHTRKHTCTPTHIKT